MRHRILKAIVTIPVSRRFHTTAFFNRTLLSKFRGGSTTKISSSSLHSTSISFNMTASNATDASSMYTYEDKDAFSSLDHPGYSMESHSENFSGGWLAHRANIEEQGSCWVKEVGPKLTVSTVSLTYLHAMHQHNNPH